MRSLWVCIFQVSQDVVELGNVDVLKYKWVSITLLFFSKNKKEMYIYITDSF